MRSRAQRGFTLIELTLAVAIISGILMAFQAMLSQGVLSWRYRAAAEHARAVAEAVAEYAMAERLDLKALLPASTANKTPIDLTGSPEWSDVLTYAQLGLVSGGEFRTNNFGQRYFAFARWGQTLPSGTTPIEILVVTRWGGRIPDDASDNIVGIIGIDGRRGLYGGFVPTSTGTGGIQPDTVYGANWERRLSDFGLTTASLGGGGKAAILIVVSQEVIDSDYLSRNLVPGDTTGDAQTMNAPIILGKPGGPCDDPLTAAFTEGCDIYNAGTIYAQDLVLRENGNIPVSRGIYNAGVFRSGAIIYKPTCPSGATPRIYTAVAAASDDGTGKDMAAIQTWTQDLGNRWRVNIRVRTSDGWISGSSDYRKVLAFWRCG